MSTKYNRSLIFLTSQCSCVTHEDTWGDNLTVESQQCCVSLFLNLLAIVKIYTLDYYCIGLQGLMTIPHCFHRESSNRLEYPLQFGFFFNTIFSYSCFFAFTCKFGDLTWQFQYNFLLKILSGCHLIPYANWEEPTILSLLWT